MAFYRKLTEGWRLTDGIYPEMLLEKPCPVYEALREEGYLPDAEEGMNALSCEWIAAREWTYSLLMEAPGEDDERILLELPCVSHAGSAYMNGEFINDFHPGAVRLDLTGAIRPDEMNRLEIRFAPALYARPQETLPVPRIGLMAAPVLRAVNFLTVERVAFSARPEGNDGILTVDMDVLAHTAGRYDFRYALMQDDAIAAQSDIAEKLPAARRRLRHEIRVKDAVFFDPARMEETIYSIRLTAQRGGVGCDVRHAETAFRKNAPAKCLAVSEWPVSGDMIDRLTELGADGIILLGAPDNRFETNDFLGGLTVSEKMDFFERTGMLRWKDISGYAAGEKAWPMDTPLWKLRGGCVPGGDAEEDADVFSRRIRFEQAVSVRRAAEQARREGAKAAFRADGEYAFFADSALIEKSGAIRPAARLLKKAWSEAHIFPEISEHGQVSLWALAESMKGSVLTATLSVRTMDGEEIGGASFPVMGGDRRLAGVMALPAGWENGYLSAELKDGMRVIARTDELLAPLNRLEETKVSVSEGRVKNEGSCAAVSAETILPPGGDAEDIGQEWLNA